MKNQLTRDGVRSLISETRQMLEASIAGRSEADLGRMMVTPEWTGLDILRHIWVWNELCDRCLADWLGSRDWILTFADEDQFNAEMVASRASASLGEAVAGIHAAYGAYATTLEGCTDAELVEEAAAPWGERLSRLALIASELGHDRHHIRELAAASM